MTVAWKEQSAISDEIQEGVLLIGRLHRSI
jgi:hypothetical protein